MECLQLFLHLQKKVGEKCGILLSTSMCKKLLFPVSNVVGEQGENWKLDFCDAYHHHHYH